jgi:chemotaxis response regulator CheB
VQNGGRLRANRDLLGNANPSLPLSLYQASGEDVMATAEFHVIAIGASAGALDAVRRITEALP